MTGSRAAISGGPVLKPMRQWALSPDAMALILADLQERTRPHIVEFGCGQSTIVFGGLSIAWFVAMTIPFIGWFFAWLVIPYLSVALWLLLMYKAYRGQRFKLPFAGDLADQPQ